MDTNETTQKKLEEINKEIAELTQNRDILLEKWNNEKQQITKIQTIKADIEKAKQQAETFEREGNLAKVAELRYGIIHKLHSELEIENDSLNRLQKEGSMLKEEVTAEDIAEVVAKSTGIQVSRLLETERQKLLQMEERLHRRIIGQNEAISVISNAIRRSRAGLQDANRPIGSFIFLGSTGIGKTEMALALAEFLFDDENAMIRIDMSEYMEKFATSRLIGAPPGYVGYEEGGQLTEAVRRKPYSVILLDEIEKAHKDVFNILLQVLDTGRLTDSKGRVVNFKNSIIIMTSNLGSELIQEEMLHFNEHERDMIFDDLKSKLVELLLRNMRPEFVNRIDEIVLFKPLTQNEIIQISNLHIDKLRGQLQHQGINLDISARAMKRIAELGYDMKFGARPLRRAIQKHIIDKLSAKLIAGEYVAGDTVFIDIDANNEFIFIKQMNNSITLSKL